jgi:transcription elongation GreA/GreB family factor
MTSPNAKSADKEHLRVQLLDRIRSDLFALERTQRDTHQAATHEENRAEHAKDTRATEQSYLARGLAERVAALRRAEEWIAALELRVFSAQDAIGLGARVWIEDAAAATRQSWWLVPAAGGLEIGMGTSAVRTITPAAPLGRALVGLYVGDEGRFETPRGERRFEVLEIA